MFSHQSALRGGVAILLPRKFKGSVLRQSGDKEGRIIGIEFKLNEEIFSVIGIYAPAVDVQEQKNSVFGEIKTLFGKFC